MLASEQTMTELYKQTGIDISNQHAKFNFDQAKSWDSTERFTNVATTWINSVSFAVGQFAGATTSLQKGGFPVTICKVYVSYWFPIMISRVSPGFSRFL